MRYAYKTLDRILGRWTGRHWLKWDEDTEIVLREIG
jgi:hypothetical protein